MRCWLISLPREDMEHCVRIGCFGRMQTYPLNHVEPDDKVVCYVTKERKIIALGEATSGHFLDDSLIFRKKDVFPDRIKFRAQSLGESGKTDFMQLVQELNFIKNKARWSVYLWSGIVEITEADWRLIAGTATFILSTYPSGTTRG